MEKFIPYLLSIDKFKNNKYSRWYFKLMLSRVNMNRTKLSRKSSNFVYYENHHILPRSIFPQYKNLSINKWNAVLLTSKEHTLAHLLLTKCFNDREDNIKMIYCGLRIRSEFKNDSLRKKALEHMSETILCKFVSNNKPLRVFKDDPRLKSGILVPIGQGMVCLREKGTSKILKVPKDSPLIANNSFEYAVKGMNKNRVPVYDSSGKRFMVYKDDPLWIRGEVKAISGTMFKGHATYENKDGKKIRTHKDDPRVISGDYVISKFGRSTKGKIHAIDSLGKIIRTEKNDIRFKTGELTKYTNKCNIGRITINNGNRTIKIYPQDADQYLKLGWVRGLLRKNKF